MSAVPKRIVLIVLPPRPRLIVVLPLPSVLKLAVSPLPGTVCGFQLLLFPQSPFALPVHVALIKGARVRAPPSLRSPVRVVPLEPVSLPDI